MKKPVPGLPSREQILDFVTKSDQPAGKREIARAFGLKGAEKIALKALLKDMGDEGLIDSAPGRAFHKMGGIPKVTVLRIVDSEGEDAFAIPESWGGAGPPPRLRVIERGKQSAMGVGDRFLARTEERGAGHVAHPMKKLLKAADLILGVVRRENDRMMLKPVDKRERHDTPISDVGEAEDGDLVLAERTGRPPRISARVTEVLGDPFAPRAFSLIAIHKHGIPDRFPDNVLDEAVMAARMSVGEDSREDLRSLPIVAIDPADARDHDDAIWAVPDDDEANVGGYRAIVAIADVSYFVRSGSPLDREAKKRGNSVYFPDRVVPMLPEALSTDVCSLKEGVDRAALVCNLTIDAKGTVKAWRFTRAVIRVTATIAYEKAQASIDDGSAPDYLRHLWAAWALLATACAARESLDLDLPERRVVLDAAGRIVHVGVHERLDAHRVVEDFMIAANVAAAKALEAKKSPVMYRIHDVPGREKLVALKDYLATFGVMFTLGQVVTPATFNRLIALVTDPEQRVQVMEQVLRSQTRAYYGSQNAGHFGLALGSYAHFTSPIRRYADLIVHRALVRSFGLGDGGLTDDEATRMAAIGEAISDTERRAMQAERETMDRYVAAHLSTCVGDEVDARITGVANFGFFATVEGVGGDGLVPVSALGDDFYRYDEASRTLEGDATGNRYAPGQRLRLKLAEANPISGALRFELPGVTPVSRGPRTTRPPMGRRGRPANIRHQGRRR